MGRIRHCAYTFFKRDETRPPPQSAGPDKETFEGRNIVITHSTFEISYVVLAFAALGAILIGALLALMHMRRQYHPNLIGALIGALLCFLVLEALPALI
jgi:hypothetical protein